MQEIINCPSCRRKLQVPESLLGQDVQCPTCHATFIAALEQYGGLPYSSAGPVPVQYGSQPAWDARAPHPARFDDFGPRRLPRRYQRRRDLLPHRGSVILVLGVLGIVPFLGIIVGPVAWILGQQDLKEIEAGRMDVEGENATNAGRICGIIGTVFNVVILLISCLLFSLIVAGA